jgi:ABC-2 type transport system permease protein
MQSIQHSLPSRLQAMKALLRADATVQLRQPSSSIMSVLIPLFFLFAWRNLIASRGATGILAGCISVGLPSIGLMGYALVISRDRELGVFRRLRITPCSTWMFMASRCLVQLGLMIAMALVTVAAALLVINVHIGPADVLKLLLAVLISGPVFISLGLLIVALFMGTETVSSATRMIYIAILVLGILSETMSKDSPWLVVAQWSPVGVTRVILANALDSGSLGLQTIYPIAAAFAYIALFGSIGIIGFRWTSSN